MAGRWRGEKGGGRCLAEWVGRGGKRNKRKETKEGNRGRNNTRVPASEHTINPMPSTRNKQQPTSNRIH